MKTIPTIILLSMLCYGNINAQNYIVSTSSNNKEKVTKKSENSDNSISNWEKNWTKESVIAIKEIIDEYGNPDENSPNRMHWILPGEIKRTITYTENLWFYLPFEVNPRDKDSVALSIKSHL